MQSRSRVTYVKLLAVAVAAALFVSVATTARADAPSPSFSIDAVPGGAIDTTRSVPVGSRFSVWVVLDTFDGAPYLSYQVDIAYDDVELDAEPGLPGNWGDPPVADVSGGNLAVFPNGPLCDPSPTTNSLTGEDDEGGAALAMTCADQATDGTSSYEGALVEIVFTCEAAGTADLQLRGEDSTYLLDPQFNQDNDHTHNATVTCGDGPAATGTPATATSTPLPATSTPATGQPTAAATTAPAVTTPSTGVTGPDTGTGPSSGTNYLAIALLAAVGTAIAATGIAWRTAWRS